MVDDEPWILIGLREKFKWNDMGFQIVGETTSSKEAWEMICEMKPDVVLTDIRMPNISGIQLIQMAREKGLTTEFVIISGFSEFQYAQDALRSGAFDYCVKPIKAEDATKLLLRLKQHLDSKKQYIEENKLSVEEEFDKEENIEIFNNKFFEMIEYINIHYRQRLQLNILAQQYYLNSNYCCYLFKRNLGTSFSEYIMKLRMKEAGKLLSDKMMTIDEVAREVGYEDYSYFYRVFKKYYKVTPLHYKREHCKGENYFEVQYDEVNQKKDE
jgi:YesN/AraC family two-component response regulator